jgi:phosphoglycerate dehydrogenase-like enzyme
MPGCLIVTPNAQEIATQIDRLANYPIAVKACISSKQALNEYTNETVVFGNPDMVAEVLPHMPAVDWVQSTWAGITPLTVIDRRDYVLTGVKAVFGSQMSEYVFAYLLGHELKLSQRMHEQREHNWFNEGSATLLGKRLGIMGTGSIGQHIAKTAERFGLTVTGLSRSGAPASGFDAVAPIGQLHDFLENIDYLVSALPQTTETDKLLDAAALAKLSAHVYLINVGRGNVVDDNALIDALKNKRLAGAALDVFNDEPLPRDSLLWDTPNLSITAHVAAASHPSLIVPIFLDNHRLYTDQQPLKHVIDLDAGY